jgi:hypothetical protein
LPNNTINANTYIFAIDRKALVRVNGDQNLRNAGVNLALVVSNTQVMQDVLRSKSNINRKTQEEE